jgi:hypothetical protein
MSYRCCGETSIFAAGARKVPDNGFEEEGKIPDNGFGGKRVGKVLIMASGKIGWACRKLIVTSVRRWNLRCDPRHVMSSWLTASLNVERR